MESQPFHVPVILWVSAMAALAPWLSERLAFLRLPVIALELVLGIAIGPQGFGLASMSASLPYMSVMGMATLFFLAGMEIDLSRLRGAPIRLGFTCWLLSLAIAAPLAYGLHAAGWLSSWVIAAVAFSTTALGVISPVLRDAELADTPLGLCATACGVMGEIGPIILASVLFAASGGQVRQGGLTLGFIVFAIVLCWASLRVRPPGLIALLARTMHRSGQWPIRLCLLLLGVLVVLAESLGLDLALGAFAAGLAVGLATRDADSEELHHKLDAIGFGFLVPIFFICSGMKLDVRALLEHPASLVLVLVVALALLVARGVAAFVAFRSHLPLRDRSAVAFYAATSLSLIVAFTNTATAAGRMSAPEGTALVGGGLLSVLVYPWAAATVLGRRAARRTRTARDADGL
jgi:Kef-type K+ transport system membrane component KefB